MTKTTQIYHLCLIILIFAQVALSSPSYRRQNYTSYSHVEYIYQPFYEVVGESFIASFFGFILFFVSLVMLFVCERSFIKFSHALQSIRKDAITIDPRNPSKFRNGVCHVLGEATVNGTIEDAFFGLRFPDAINVMRKVEIYQWRETKRSITVTDGAGGKITRDEYTYDLQWSEGLIDSTGFHVGGYDNPVNVPIKSELWTNDVMVKSLGVSRDITSKIGDLKVLKLREEKNVNVLNIENVINTCCDDYTIYVGRNVSQPELGDMKVQYSAIRTPITVSIIAFMKQNSFLEPIVIENNAPIAIIKTGIFSINQLIDGEESSNQQKKWLSRIGFWLLNWFSLLLITGPLFTLTQFIPLFNFFFATKTFFSTLYTSLKLSVLAGLFAQDFIQSFPKMAIIILVLSTGILFF